MGRLVSGKDKGGIWATELRDGEDFSAASKRAGNSGDPSVRRFKSQDELNKYDRQRKSGAVQGSNNTANQVRRAQQNQKAKPNMQEQIDAKNKAKREAQRKQMDAQYKGQ